MRRIQVLAIEDNSADVFWLETVLNDVGLDHALSVAEDGAQGLDFLLKCGEFETAPTPDIIFLDSNLPRLNGAEVLRKVPHPETLPLCVLTSSIEDRDRFRDEFGIEEPRYLIKPVSRDRLLSCLRSYTQLRPILEQALHS